MPYPSNALHLLASHCKVSPTHPFPSSISSTQVLCTPRQSHCSCLPSLMHIIPHQMQSLSTPCCPLYRMSTCMNGTNTCVRRNRGCQVYVHSTLTGRHQLLRGQCSVLRLAANAACRPAYTCMRTLTCPCPAQKGKQKHCRPAILHVALLACIRSMQLWLTHLSHSMQP